MKAITLIFTKDSVAWVRRGGKRRRAAFLGGDEVSGVPFPYVVEGKRCPIGVLDLLTNRGDCILCLPWRWVRIKQDPVRTE